MDDDDKEGLSLSKQDLLFNIIGVFIALLLVVQLMISDPKKAETESTQAGDMIVSVFWPEGNADIDLWLWSSNDSRAVYYNNKQGKVWNLLRDDVGNSNDTLPVNYENAFSRGAPAGSYTINVYCFSRCATPVKVKVLFEMRNAGHIVKVLEKDVILEYDQDWETIINFALDKNAKIIEQNDTQKDLTQ